MKIVTGQLRRSKQQPRSGGALGMPSANHFEVCWETIELGKQITIQKQNKKIIKYTLRFLGELARRGFVYPSGQSKICSPHSSSNRCACLRDGRSSYFLQSSCGGAGGQLGALTLLNNIQKLYAVTWLCYRVINSAKQLFVASLFFFESQHDIICNIKTTIFFQSSVHIKSMIAVLYSSWLCIA